MAEPELRPEPTRAEAVTAPNANLVAEEERKQNRWFLIRETLVFEAKMLLEGVRDILLAPLVLLAGVLGLLVGGQQPQRFLLSTLRVGRRFDHWLALYSPVEGEFRERSADPEPPTSDAYLRRLEQILVDQHERGGATAQVKQRVDEFLDSLEKASAEAQQSLRRRAEARRGVSPPETRAPSSADPDRPSPPPRS